MSEEIFEALLNGLEEIYKKKDKLGEFNDEKHVYNKLIPSLCSNLKQISYVLKEPFSLGSTATVWKVKDTLNQIKALKLPRPRLSKLSNIIKIIREEKDKLAKLNHQNIIKIYSASEIALKIGGDDYSFPYFIMEFIKGVEDLDKYIINNLHLMNAVDIIGYFRDLTHGLTYLHEHSIIHCDIKPGNLLIADKTPALIADLGYAKHFSRIIKEDKRITQVKYTPEYAHPELNENMKEFSDPNASAAEIPRESLRPAFDLYAMGRSIQEVLQKISVAESLDVESFRKRAHKSIFTQYQWLYLSFIAKRLLDGQVERPGEDNFASDVIPGLSPSVMSEIRYSNAREALEDFEKLLHLYDLEGTIPEINPNISTYIQIPHCKVPLTTRVEKVISHPTFRRLARVTQLGLISYLYPGAAHSRFEHILGTFSNCCNYICSLWYDKENCLFQCIMSSKDLELGLISALLHDIGHYPMAHDLAEVSSEFSHENFDYQFIEKMDYSCGETLAQVIESEWSVKISEISNILNANKESTFRQRILNSIINSPLDCDKLDYLKRDSTHLGVEFGKSIDHERFIRNLTIVYKSDVENGVSREEHQVTKLKIAEIGVTEKALAVAKSIWRIRQDMFTQIYWHHTVRALKVMLKYIVLNILISLKDEDDKFNFWKSFNDLICSNYIQIEAISKDDLSDKVNSSEKEGIEDYFEPIEPISGSFSGLSISDDSLLSLLYQFSDRAGKQVIELIRERRLYKRLAVLSRFRRPLDYDNLYMMFWTYRMKENFILIERQRQEWENKIMQDVEKNLKKNNSLIPRGYTVKTLLEHLRKDQPLILVDIPIRSTFKQSEEEVIRYLPEDIIGFNEQIAGIYPRFQEVRVYLGEETFDKTVGKIRVFVNPKWSEFIKNCITDKRVMDIICA